MELDPNFFSLHSNAHSEKVKGGGDFHGLGIGNIKKRGEIGHRAICYFLCYERGREGSVERERKRDRERRGEGWQTLIAMMTKDCIIIVSNSQNTTKNAQIFNPSS